MQPCSPAALQPGSLAAQPEGTSEPSTVNQHHHTGPTSQRASLMPHLCQPETKEFIKTFHTALLCDFVLIEIIGSFMRAKVTKGGTIQMNRKKLIALTWLRVTLMRSA